VTKFGERTIQSAREGRAIAVAMMSLIEVDRKVLSWMAAIYATAAIKGSRHNYVTPAEIGVVMGGTVMGKPQGLGRIGGRRAKRLREMGLVEDCSAMCGGFPASRGADLAEHQCPNGISGHGPAALISAWMWRASSSFSAKA
jgi:hypothetical protein